MRWVGWFGGVMISLAILQAIPGQQGFFVAFCMGAGCSLLGYLIGIGAESRGQ